MCHYGEEYNSYVSTSSTNRVTWSVSIVCFSFFLFWPHFSSSVGRSPDIDFYQLTNLMKKVSHEVINGGGIVRGILNHGIRDLPQRFRAKYPDKQGNWYYEKGRFISIYYDSNPLTMRLVEQTLAMNEEVLRNTHLKARSILDFANISRAERHPYILGSSGDCELDLSGLLFKCCARQDERKNGLGGMDDHHDENRALANGKHACMDVIVSFVISVCMIIASFLFVPSPSIQLVHGIDQHDKRASLHCEIDWPNEKLFVTVFHPSFHPSCHHNHLCHP